jgi:hypothetical protein
LSLLLFVISDVCVCVSDQLPGGGGNHLCSTLREVANRGNLSLVAVDEAHVVSGADLPEGGGLLLMFFRLSLCPEGGGLLLMLLRLSLFHLSFFRLSYLLLLSSSLLSFSLSLSFCSDEFVSLSFLTWPVCFVSDRVGPRLSAQVSRAGLVGRPAPRTRHRAHRHSHRRCVGSLFSLCPFDAFFFCSSFIILIFIYFYSFLLSTFFVRIQSLDDCSLL